MEKMYTEEKEEIEIDLRELLFELKKRLWMIIVALILGIGIVGAGSAFLITPQYKSEAKLYILSKETTLTSLADLQIGSQLTQDYKVLVSSRPVMEGVINHLNLDYSYKELAGKLTVENPQNTRILSLTVRDENPYMAKQIVDDIANTASDYIGEIMEMVPPKMIEDGVVASEPYSPSMKRNALLGGILAVFLICALIAVRVVFNDTVKSEEDVERYLSMPVLAVIPKKREKGKKKEKNKSMEEAKKEKMIKEEQKWEKPLEKGLKEDVKGHKEEEQING